MAVVVKSMNPEFVLQRIDKADLDQEMRDEFRAYFQGIELAYEYQPYWFWIFSSEEERSELLPSYLERELRARISVSNVVIAEREVWVWLMGGLPGCDVVEAFVVEALTAHDNLVVRGDIGGEKDLEGFKKMAGIA